jgi:endo-1,4-beta-xylanase
MARMLLITLLLLLAASATASPGVLHVTFTDAAGGAIPKAQIKALVCRDLSEEPLALNVKLHDGAADITLPNQPIELDAMIDTPGFGEVKLFIDGNGSGYSKAGTIDFVTEAAATRLLRVQTALNQATAEGVALPADFAKRLADAASLTHRKSLPITLALGEELTLARAQGRIERFGGPRKDFLFGCNAMGYPARGPIYQQHFRELFNYGTSNLYLTGYAPTQTTRNYDRCDRETNWVISNGMTAKTCPPFYLATGVLPEWLKQKSFPEVLTICHDLVRETCKRYAGKSKFCEITNEATMSNGLKLTTDQIIQMTEAASNAAREGDPEVGRIINSAHLWGDFAAKADKQGNPRLSPYAYLRACIKARIPFEIVGLQMYHPEYDLLEIDRMLDRYAALGKPIHITEMGCSSAPGIDPNAQRKVASEGWHGPWSEDMQADWVTGVYTIFYSKSYIHAVSWWDLADAVSFWPYGGFLRGDCSPKPAFTRLKALQEKWGYHFGG